MNRHRHTVDHESGPHTMAGRCGCPGCHNASAYYVERCTCGAERTVCSGMGAASMPQHRRHGYATWQMEDESGETLAQADEHAGIWE